MNALSFRFLSAHFASNRIFLAVISLLLAPAALLGQSPTYKPAGPAQDSIARAVSLAETGRCAEALPVLKGVARVADKQLRYHAAMAAARCAMSVQDTPSAVSALMLLQHDFPADPEVLYVCTHFFSQLANRAAQELADTAPTSPQVQKLNAEALESAEKWDDAIAAYRRILDQDPQQHDVHYHVAQIMLNRPAYPTAADDARAELDAELKINPRNAAAEFMLGELARRDAKWEDAIAHFSQASKFDVGFSEAYLALGMSLNSAGRYPEAVRPLERYVKMEADDPAGHYQLAQAYARTGNKDGAARESELQRQAAAKNPAISH
jgi:predicted Zn-dependent protease